MIAVSSFVHMWMNFVFSFETCWLHENTYTDHDETVCEKKCSKPQT